MHDGSGLATYCPTPTGHAQYVVKASAVWPEEGRRYNAFVERVPRLRHNLGTLLNMASDVKIKLLQRDRILWYWRGVLDMQGPLVFQHGKALLEKNLNVKPGNPLEIRTLVGVVRLGGLREGQASFWT